MNAQLLPGIIYGIEQLVGLIVEARRNGSLTDAQLEAATKATNEETRQMIAAAIAKMTPPITQ